MTFTGVALAGALLFIIVFLFYLFWTALQEELELNRGPFV